MNHDHDMMSPMGSLSCVRARYIQSLTNPDNMVDATIYFVYLPSKNLNAVGWIMHTFKFDNRRELFFCTVRQESRRQRDRNPNLNLEGISNESEYREN